MALQAVTDIGYDADLASPSNHPLRMAIRQELAKRKIPSLEGIKEFVARHKRPNDTAELSQYISFALSCTGPPNFEFKQRDVDIPPDVSGMTALSPLLAGLSIPIATRLDPSDLLALVGLVPAALCGIDIH